jgi:hypothetical protein
MAINTVAGLLCDVMFVYQAVILQHDKFPISPN